MRLQVAPIRRVVRRYGGIAFDWVRWKVDCIYDYHHGIDTSGIIDIPDLSIASENRIHAARYQSSSPLLFRTMMKHVPIAHEDFTFIDLGSGKGRAILLASEYPFAEIIGIEFSEQLHAIAANNLAVYRNGRQQCNSIRSVCMDVSDYALPARNMVLHLYNPFDEVILSTLMSDVAHIVRDHAVNICIMYCHALHAGVIERSGLFPYVRNVKIPPLVMRRPREISRALVYSNHPMPASI